MLARLCLPSCKLLLPLQPNYRAAAAAASAPGATAAFSFSLRNCWHVCDLRLQCDLALR